MLWKFLLTPSNGAINAALLNLGLIGEHIEWFNSGVSLWSIIIADVWNWTALPLLIIYSRRVSLPPAVYEAARVDGASGWLVLRRITLPMLKEVIAIAFIIRFMDAIKHRLAMGLSPTEIARELRISRGTVYKARADMTDIA